MMSWRKRNEGRSERGFRRRAAIETLESRTLLTGEISGIAWQDLNDDGNFDAETELPLAGWTVYLDQNRNGQYDDGEMAQLSDASGGYRFTGLAPGEYVVGKVQQENFTRTKGDSAYVPPGGLNENPAINHNIELIGEVPFNVFGNGTVKANDLTAYVSPSGREYAIIGLNRSIAFVEVTDPRNPVLVSHILGLDEPNGGTVLFNRGAQGLQLGDQNLAMLGSNGGDSDLIFAAHCHDECDIDPPAEGSTWRDIKTYQEHAYAVVDLVSKGGVHVMDLRQIDDGFVFTVDQGGTLGAVSSHNASLNADSGFLYTSGSSHAARGLMAFDLSDPSHPVFVGGYAGRYFHDAIVVSYTEGPMAGREIAYGFAENLGVTVLDVTNKADFRVLATLVYPNIQYAHFGALSTDRRLLFVNDEKDELIASNPVSTSTTYVLNVEDPSNPYYLTNFTNGQPAVDHNPMVIGDYIFEANYESGLRIFDISQDHFVHEVGYYDTYPTSTSRSFHGAWGVDASLPSGTVIVSDIQRGLLIFDVSRAIGPKGTYLVEIVGDESVENIDFGSRREFLIDDLDEQFIEIVGPWGLTDSPSSLSYLRHGSSTHNLRNSIDPNTEQYSFLPPIDSSGEYEVYLHWVSSESLNSSVPVEIMHANGVTHTTIDQTRNGGRWNSLGIFPFDPESTSKVTIRATGTTAVVVADAVRVVQRSVEAPAQSIGAELSSAEIDEASGSSAASIQLQRPVGDDLNFDRFVTLTTSDPTEARVRGAALSYSVDLLPANTVPPSGAQSSGSAQMTLREVAGGLALDYSIQLNGIDLDGQQTPADPDDDLTAIHLHFGAADTNGQMLFGIVAPNHDVDDLVIDAANGVVSGTWDPPDVKLPLPGDIAPWLEQFANGLIYINVHTVQNEPGEVRGYLVPNDDTTRLVPIFAFSNSTNVPLIAVDDSDLDGPQSVEITITSAGLADTSVQLVVSDNEGIFPGGTVADRSGATASLLGQVDASRLNLFDGIDDPNDLADVQLIGNSLGLVSGSLLWDATASQLRFVKTGGPLEPDDYTLTLFARDDALTDMVGHPLGQDIVYEFSIDSASDVVVRLPDVVRGSGQVVNLEASGGIPIVLAAGEGVLNVEFVVAYDPQLLDVQTPLLAQGLPEGWMLEVADISTPGLARIRVVGSTALTPGDNLLAVLPATIPEMAELGAAAVLETQAVLINDVAMDGAGDAAVQLVAYPGDTTGSKDFSSFDASLVARVAVGLDNGFDFFDRFDPALIGDVSGNGELSGFDASLIARKAVGFEQDDIPDIPRPLPPPPAILTSPTVRETIFAQLVFDTPSSETFVDEEDDQVASDGLVVDEIAIVPYSPLHRMDASETTDQLVQEPVSESVESEAIASGVEAVPELSDGELGGL